MGLAVTAFKKMVKSPKLLFKPGNLIKRSFSACVFAVFGYSNFKKPSNYAGWSKSAYVIGKHIKAYVSQGKTCFDVGVGPSTSLFGIGSSAAIYVNTAVNIPGISNLFNATYGKASRLRK